MKRQRVPYATRAVWPVLAVLAIVLVIGGAVAGYEIHHLQTDVDGLKNQVSVLYQALLKAQHH